LIFADWKRGCLQAASAQRSADVGLYSCGWICGVCSWVHCSYCALGIGNYLQTPAVRQPLAIRSHGFCAFPGPKVRGTRGTRHPARVPRLRRKECAGGVHPPAVRLRRLEPVKKTRICIETWTREHPSEAIARVIPGFLRHS